MTTAKTIFEHVRSLPERLRARVLEYVERLNGATEELSDTSENFAWLKLSLAAAMRGMEDEEDIYSIDDVRVNLS